MTEWPACAPLWPERPSSDRTVNVYLTGTFDLSIPGAARRVADQIAEALDEKLGGREADADLANGSPSLP